jgi:N12 class adenine-specific DNA methylase
MKCSKEEILMSTVLEYLLKWGLGIVTGAVATFFLYVRKDFAEYRKYKKQKRKKEFLQDVNGELSTLENKMEHHEEEAEKELAKHDKLYLEKLEDLERKIMEILIPIQEATLSSHYEALLNKCKTYIKAGEISVDDLDLLEKDYDTYHSLKGNGHMEMWMVRVRKLSVI